jgi:hypothetical protein
LRSMRANEAEEKGEEEEKIIFSPAPRINKLYIISGCGVFF